MENIATKSTGDQLTATEFNQIPSELENAITDSGQTLSAADLYQISKAMATYSAGGNYFTDSGAADAYVLSVIGSKRAPAAYFVGMTCRFRPTNNNTGASTVNVASLGVKNIKLADGSTNPSAGDIATTSDCAIVYDGTSFRLLNIQFERLAITGDVSIGDDVDITGNLTVSEGASGTPDANTIYKDNIVKGWICFNGTGTIAILDSFNVSGIVDNGTGNYTVTWDRDFANVNYCSLVSSGNSFTYYGTKAVGSLVMQTANSSGSAEDTPNISVMGIGDQ